MSKLKNLAQKAKHRLLAISKGQEATIQKEETSQEKPYTEACLSAKIQYAIILNKTRIEDDPLYGKIKRILTKDVDIMNPLSQIIEHDIYDNLTDKQKEKYMYTLSKRYTAIKSKVLKDLASEPEQA